MKSEYHVVIVGSGIGRLCAASTLAGHGLDILIIDENIHPGGQLLRKSENQGKQFLNVDPDLMKVKGFSLIQKISELSGAVDQIHQAQVLGIFKDRRLLVHTRDQQHKGQKRSGQIVEIQAQKLILATGARERCLPFKGWTLPGVMSLGAAQILIKNYGVLPGFQTIIAGTSPLMAVLAAQIARNNGEIAAVVDGNGYREKLRFLPLIKHHWPKLLEGAFYIAQMMLYRIPMMHHTRILEARGKDKFTSVVMAKSTRDGQVIDGTQTICQGDVLAVGNGFVPNIELAVQAGCNIEYHEDSGGWVVITDQHLESSVDSIYAAGEVTGIAGAKKSYIQGKIAAISILEKLDKLILKNQEDLFLKQMKQLHAINDQQNAYAAFLNRLCRLPSSAYMQIPDDTLVCRCENITMSTIKKTIRDGFTTSIGLKKATRSGMGRCQGKICGPVIHDIITALTRKSPGEICPPLSRVPVKNVSIRSFLNKAS